MSYLKKKPALPVEEPMPKKLHKEHPRRNNLEELVGIIKEEPLEKPAWDGSSDELKLIYHIITGTTSHTTKAKMLQTIKEWTEGVD
jgi:hypothetical protein